MEALQSTVISQDSCAVTAIHVGINPATPYGSPPKNFTARSAPYLHRLQVDALGAAPHHAQILHRHATTASRVEAAFTAALHRRSCQLRCCCGCCLLLLLTASQRTHGLGKHTLHGQNYG